jgi:transposase
LRHGLLRASYVPPQPIRALRELTRYRKRLVQERAQQANRLHKVLEAANIKLATVASDVLGTSAREMVEALIAGETDVAVIASHARSRMRAKIPQLQRALTGRLQPHHRFLWRAILTHIDFLQLAVSHVTQEIEQRLQPYDEAVRLLQTIPGIQASAAATIVAEIGVDMTRFPSAKHLASWAGGCPGNKQSGGKRMAETTTKGSPWLRAMLGEIAWSISHSRDNYLVAQYRRLSKRLGPHKAAVAVAHSVLCAGRDLPHAAQPHSLHRFGGRLL